MEVILLENVPKLGKKGEVIKVNEGYARNCLFRKNLAIEATSVNLNNLKLQNANNAKIAKEKLEEAKKLAEELKEALVTVSIKTGAGGKTFGSISGKEIAQAIKDQLNMDIDKKKLHIEEPIKSLGTHIVKIKLHPEVTGELAVKVKEI